MKVNHKVNSLWSSHIHCIKYNVDDEVNKDLADIARKHVKENFNFDVDFKHSKPANVLLLHKSKNLVWLFNEIKTNLMFYVRHHYNIMIEDLDVEYNMWGNVEKHTEWSLPHSHHGNQLVITYYPYVNVDRTIHKYAGSFCWHPTTSYMPDFMVRKEPAFFPHVLETGSMVIFNGHAPHSTFPCFSKDDEKVAFVTNIRFRLKGSKKTYTPSKEILEFQLNN
jgi:hypothetical protein